MEGPQAKLVAVTRFLGVPEDVYPDEAGQPDYGPILDRDQDLGSECARLTELAGRECYDSYERGRSSAEFHNHIIEVGHGSVLTHANLSFRVWNISRGLSHELVRHHVGVGISQRSTRYVDESRSANCWHPLIYKYILMDNGGDSKEQQEVVDYIHESEGVTNHAYQLIVEFLEKKLCGEGVDKVTARKQARGAARGVLPNALETSLIWTVNLRALRNIIEQRASAGADAEIRLLADVCWEAAKLEVPEYFSDYTREECPDGIGYALSTPFRKV